MSDGTSGPWSRTQRSTSTGSGSVVERTRSDRRSKPGARGAAVGKRSTWTPSSVEDPVGRLFAQVTASVVALVSTPTSTPRAARRVANWRQAASAPPTIWGP
jgi:hypothetical protein